MTTATEKFSLTELARVTVDTVDYVVYSDGSFRWAVDADSYDDVDEGYSADDYSLWCAEDDEGVSDAHRCARIAAAAGLEGVHVAGTGVWCEAAGPVASETEHAR